MTRQGFTVPDFIDCVEVTVVAGRVADLSDAAKKAALSAFEGYWNPAKGWVSAQGDVLVAYRRSYARPADPLEFGADRWQADYLVGPVR